MSSAEDRRKEVEIEAVLVRLIVRTGRRREDILLYAVSKLTDELPGVDRQVKAALAGQLALDSGCLPPGALRHLRALSRMTLKEINQALSEAAQLFGRENAGACKEPGHAVPQTGRS